MLDVKFGDALCAAATALAATIIVVPYPPWLQVTTALFLVLIAPGYAMMSAMYPTSLSLSRSLAVASEGRAIVVKLALSVCLSTMLAGLLAAGLASSPLRLTRISFLLAITGSVALGLIVAALRRRRSGDTKGPVAREMPTSRARLNREQVVASGLILVICAVGVFLAVYANMAPPLSESTEFYILGSAGLAQDYPVDVLVGEEVSIIIGIVHHAPEPALYNVSAVYENETGPVGLPSVVQVAASPGERWIGNITVAAPTEAGRYTLVLILSSIDRQDVELSLRTTAHSEAIPRE